MVWEKKRNKSEGIPNTHIPVTLTRTCAGCMYSVNKWCMIWRWLMGSEVEVISGAPGVLAHLTDLKVWNTRRPRDPIILRLKYACVSKHVEALLCLLLFDGSTSNLLCYSMRLHSWEHFFKFLPYVNTKFRHSVSKIFNQWKFENY